MKVFLCCATVLFLSTMCNGQFDLCFRDPNTNQAPQTAFNFTGVDAFGFRLLDNIAKGMGATDQNLMLSPYSIWSALSLALMGSQGNTRRQLEKALGLPNTKLGAYRTKYALDFVLSASGSGAGGGPEIMRSDRGYFDASLGVKACVRNAIHNVEILNFRDSGSAAAKINDDVSVGTGGHIKDFLSPTALVNSVFVLINAVYFKGSWASKFQTFDTNKQVFYNTRGDRVASVDMMTQQGQFNIVRAPALGATMLELPYAKSNISMFVLLPDVSSPEVDRVLENLNPYTFGQALKARQKTPVKVFLPKFDLKTEVESELVSALNAQGVTDMFNPAFADFSDFSDQKPLAADTVIHQAKVKVDEEGTVAAAATAVVGTRAGPPREFFQFVVNRPFVFLIHDKRTRITLFAGVVRNPNK